jgi:hypothetical protein
MKICAISFSSLTVCKPSHRCLASRQGCSKYGLRPGSWLAHGV